TTTTWVEPRYVCEVQYREVTPDGLLRHSSFLRLRDDKRPDECERARGADASSTAEMTADGSSGELAVGGDDVDSPLTAHHSPPAASERIESVPPPPSPAAPSPRTTKFSNLAKVYWPAEKYTKGDLIEYYRAAAPWLLPYLRNRPLVMTPVPHRI